MPKFSAIANRILHRNTVSYNSGAVHSLLPKKREEAELGHIYATQRGTNSFLNNLSNFALSAKPRRRSVASGDVNSPYRLEQREVRGKMKTLVARGDQVTSAVYPDLNENEVRDQDYRIETDPEKLVLRLKNGLNNAEAQLDLGESDFYKYCQIGNELKTYGLIRNIKSPSQVDESDLKYKTLKNGVCVASMQGLRPTMEDKHLAKNFEISLGDKILPVQLQGVFDGHSGIECSRYVKKNLVAFIQQALQKEANINGKLEDLNIYNACKIGMVNLSRSFSKRGGSTVNFSLILDGKLVVVNTGDARAILVSPTSVKQLSEDAKPGIERYRKTVLNRGGGISKDSNGVTRVDGRLSVARAVGDHVFGGHMSARPKITILPMAEIAAEAGGNLDNSYVFHGCDGVFDVASSRQVGANILARLAEGKTLQHVTAEIVCSSYGTGSKDNLTGMLVPLLRAKEVSEGYPPAITP